ncbi:hypothetical protein B0H17DRAFT_1195822 [Mycena rosella]|uniref:Uncharacterized protein n=1 Tax=Mycena rosella TaxID=1033263 RepID=A0AAD7DV24_MYCRO|nr:hypothetical protein B0H17DRAFT_1195822 [Mycena rosella]
MPAKHTRRNCAAPETPNQGATPKQARIGDLPAMTTDHFTAPESDAIVLATEEIVARNRPSHVSEEYDSSSVLTEDAECSRDAYHEQPALLGADITKLQSQQQRDLDSVKVQPTATKVVDNTVQYSVAVQGQGIATKLSTNMNKSAVPHHRHQSSSDIADGQGSVVTDIGVDEKRNSS